MTTISQVNNTTPGIPSEASGARSAAGNSALATIDNLIAMLQKMNSEIRDMQRDFYASQQQTAHKKDLTAIATKEKAIELNYSAAKSNATAKIWSGVLSTVGAVAGGMASGGGEAITGGLNGMGKTIEGGTAWTSAAVSRDAQEMQLLGDYQSNAASEYYKNLAATADKASEASRRMLEMTRELLSLQDRILGAVRL